MTHEVGHWLDLLHIWGDDGSACSGSDSCADTPNQAGSSLFGPCRTFPAVSCSNGPNGDMFMNYMDYSADECMNTFTVAQVARMDAALHTARAAILASDGLVPATGTPGPDLWMKDVSDDFGTEPDPSAQPMYISDDIWVRTSNDGLLNQDHQNAEYRPPGSPSNFVYVRVRNRGCTGSGTATGTLKLYWAKASTGLSWPAPWDGSVSTPALMGSLIGSQSVSVAGGDDEIAVFPWMPPNPADYASFGAGQTHFCLLARIETSPTVPFGMTSPETSNLYANVQNNNNIVWKNISVVDEVPGSGRFASVIVANFTNQMERVTLTFQTPRDAKPSIFDWGEVLVELPPELLRLREGQQDGTTGCRLFEDATFQLLEPRAKLGVFKLVPGSLHTVNVRFLPRQRIPLGARVFTLDLVQEAAGRVGGGQRFVLKTVPDYHGIAVETPGAVFDGVDWVPVGGGTKGYGCCCK